MTLLPSLAALYLAICKFRSRRSCAALLTQILHPPFVLFLHSASPQRRCVTVLLCALYVCVHSVAVCFVCLRAQCCCVIGMSACHSVAVCFVCLRVTVSLCALYVCVSQCCCVLCMSACHSVAVCFVCLSACHSVAVCFVCVRVTVSGQGSS